MVYIASTVLTVERVRRAYKYKLTLSGDKSKVRIEGGDASGDYQVHIDSSVQPVRRFIKQVPLPKGPEEPHVRRVEVTLPEAWFHA